jgi:hypothetical protein
MEKEPEAFKPPLFDEIMHELDRGNAEIVADAESSLDGTSEAQKYLDGIKRRVAIEHAAYASLFDVKASSKRRLSDSGEFEPKRALREVERHIKWFALRDKLQIKALASRIEALEATSGVLKYVGVWQSGGSYVKGNFVTQNGAVWHCNVATRAKPGTGSDWTLAVKAGRDGKDAGR